LKASNIRIILGEEILKETSVMRKNYICASIAVLLVDIGLGLFISRLLVKPFKKLIETAEKIAKSEEIDEEYLKNNTMKKTESEIDELVQAISAMNKDIKENLNEVTRQKKQIETILLHMTDGIIAFNIEGDIIHINHAAKTLLKIDNENSSFEEIFDKFDVDINMEKIIYLENWTSSEKKVTVDDKSINLFFAPFKNENDRPAGVIVVIQDITEHVKLDSMRKEFVADVSHELKTPITSIKGFADTLLENEDLDKNIERNFLERISSEAQRMSDLVYDLLTLSRYDTSRIKVERTEFDLGELVKYIFDGLKLEMDKKSINGECLITSNVPLVYADKSGIQRVIINIVTNAIKYTPENGTIKAYVGFVYNDAYIKIKDTGIGISEEDLGKIFERFYRVDKSRTREYGGTGLGLSIAKEILDKNDGRIDIKSELGEGTEVVIRIPTKQGLEKYNKDENETKEN
jgi:two-component system sensor histidine kinase VicK